MECHFVLQRLLCKIGAASLPDSFGTVGGFVAPSLHCILILFSSNQEVFVALCPSFLLSKSELLQKKSEFSKEFVPMFWFIYHFPVDCSLICQYLQIMASSLNGLSVGDSLSDNIMVSPARSETASSFRFVCSHLVYINYRTLLMTVYVCILHYVLAQSKKGRL